MDNIIRRNFFKSLFCSAALTLPSRAADADTRKFVTRRMDEMTSREVELYLKDGGDLVFIPFGPVSGHGAFIPMGMHAHWANALSVLLAEKANGLVSPPRSPATPARRARFVEACRFRFTSR